MINLLLLMSGFCLFMSGVIGMIHTDYPDKKEREEVEYQRYIPALVNNNEVGIYDKKLGIILYYPKATGSSSSSVK